MKGSRGVTVSLVLVSAAIALGVWLRASDSIVCQEGGGGPSEEYGSLADAHLAEVLKGTTDQQSDGPAPDSSERPDPVRERRPPRAGSRAGEAYRVFGSPAQEFDREKLKGLDFREAEIDAIHARFRAFITELHGSDSGARITPSSRLTPEQREENRRLRMRYLTDREFDAALFATRQNNRAVLSRDPAPGSPAASVGLRKGDEIVLMNGIRVFDLQDYRDGRKSKDEGDFHQMIVARGARFFEVSLLCCSARLGSVSMRWARPLTEEPSL
jgi:hypothetical protein